MSSDRSFPISSLAEAATFINGDRSTNYPSQDDYIKDGIPFVSASDLQDERIQTQTVKRITPTAFARLRAGKIEPDDVLFCLRGSIGKLALVRRGEVGAIASSLVIVRAKESVDPRFLFSFLRSASGQHSALSLNNGSAQPNLSVRQLQRVRLPLPPRDVQSGIAEVLGALDDRIALLRETNATLEAIAQALFRSWFVDFDPVRAKSQGLPPACMDEETAALFPDGFESKDVGPIPIGWRPGTLADYATLNLRSWSTRSHPDRIVYLDLANVKDNEVTATFEWAFNEAPSRARRALCDGDTIVGTVRPGNRSFAYIYRPPPAWTASTGFAVLSPLVPENAAFVYLSATQDSSIEHLAHIADGGAYPAVRPDAVAALSCVVAPAEILRAFDALARPLLEKVASNRIQARTLATLRDTLLPRLISGQLRLPEAKKALAG